MKEKRKFRQERQRRLERPLRNRERRNWRSGYKEDDFRTTGKTNEDNWSLGQEDLAQPFTETEQKHL